MIKRVLILAVLLLGIAGTLWGCGCGASTGGTETTTTTSTTSSDSSTTTGTDTTTTTGGGGTTTSSSNTTTTTAYIAPGWARYTIDTSGNVNEQTSIALSAGQPYISYYSNYLYTAYRDSGSVWHTELVDNSNYSATGQYSSIAIASDNYPHVSYSDLGALKYAYKTASGWTWEAADGSADVIYNSIALDGSNKPYIAYYDQSLSKQDLKFADKTSGSWSVPVTVDSGGDVGQYCSIDLDTSNYPHISYYDATNGDLKYAYKDGSGWHTTTVDSSGNVGSFTHIVLDGSNRPHISYYDQTNGDLKYAYYNGSSWTTQTVESANDVGKYTAIAINSSGYPIITYFDSTNLSLRYASYDGSTWHPTLIAANAGYFSSLALDTSNKAHVSYVDSGAGYLMYAGEL